MFIRDAKRDDKKREEDRRSDRRDERRDDRREDKRDDRRDDRDDTRSRRDDKRDDRKDDKRDDRKRDEKEREDDKEKKAKANYFQTPAESFNDAYPDLFFCSPFLSFLPLPPFSLFDESIDIVLLTTPRSKHLNRRSSSLRS